MLAVGTAGRECGLQNQEKVTEEGQTSPRGKCNALVLRSSPLGLWQGGQLHGVPVTEEFPGF